MPTMVTIVLIQSISILILNLKYANQNSIKFCFDIKWALCWLERMGIKEQVGICLLRIFQSNTQFECMLSCFLAFHLCILSKLVALCCCSKPISVRNTFFFSFAKQRKILIIYLLASSIIIGIIWDRFFFFWFDDSCGWGSANICRCNTINRFFVIVQRIQSVLKWICNMGADFEHVCWQSWSFYQSFHEVCGDFFLYRNEKNSQIWNYYWNIKLFFLYNFSWISINKYYIHGNMECYTKKLFPSNMLQKGMEKLDADINGKYVLLRKKVAYRPKYKCTVNHR